MKKLLLSLLVSIAVPAWAGDAPAAPNAASGQAAAAQPAPAKPMQLAKADVDPAAAPLQRDTATEPGTPSASKPSAKPVPGPATQGAICQKQVCNGFTACFLPRCGAACTGSC